MSAVGSQVTWNPPHWAAGSSSDGTDEFEVLIDWQPHAAFRSLGEALKAAGELSRCVLVRIGGLGEFSCPLTTEQRTSIDAYVASARERHARERARYDSPVEWFVAFLDPDAEDLDEAASLVVGAQRVTSARIRRRTWYGGDERWLVLRVMAVDRETASRVAFEAAVRVIWPPERPRVGGDRWFVTIGHTEVGLAEYEDEELRDVLDASNGASRSP